MAITPLKVKAILERTKPFNKLLTQDLEGLLKKSTQRQYAKGEILYSEGDSADRAWVLLEGRIQILKQSPSGKPHAIESIYAGGLFGTLCRIGNIRKTYPCTAVAATDCRTLEIPDSIFEGCYKRLPDLMFSLCQLCSERLNAVQDATCGSQEPADHRIAGVLLTLQKSNGETLPFTRREIAELANTTIETTIRILSLFTQRGWIQSSRGKIELKSILPLEELLHREA